jgi:hypothetical protein
MIVSSFVDAIAITPSDTAANEFDAIYVGVSDTNGEDVAIVPANGGASVIFLNVLQGTIIPIKTKRVLMTGTDAESLVGLRY